MVKYFLSANDNVPIIIKIKIIIKMKKKIATLLVKIFGTYVEQ